MDKTEQTIILIMISIIIASGFVMLSQRNQFNDLNNKYNALEAEYDSILLRQVESQQHLESEIVYETLKIVLIEEKISSLHDLIHDTDTIILSTELIENVTVPRHVGGFRLLLLSPEEIESRAKAEGDFLFLRFEKFDPNPDNILVSIQTAGIFDYVEGIGIYFKITGTVSSWWIS